MIHIHDCFETLGNGPRYFFLFMLEETVLDIDESFGLSTFKGLFSYFCSFHVCWTS